MKPNDFPSILQPGVLRQVNDDVIGLLGTPVFFSAPERPNWPLPGDPAAKLYVAVTALHSVYHDRGTRVLRCYLEFCENTFWDEFVPSQHVARVEALRNGLCHGSLSGGRAAREFAAALHFYGITDWPPDTLQASQSLCERLLHRLTAEADEMLRYLIKYAQKLAATTKLFRWRKTLVHEVMNPEHVLYGEAQGEERFFGLNMVWDLANLYPGEKDKAELSRAVRRWLTEMRPELLNGRIGNSDTLPDTLTAAIRSLYEKGQEDDPD